MDSKNTKPIATIVKQGIFSLNKDARELIGSLQKRTIKGFVTYCFDGIQYMSEEQCQQRFKKFLIVPDAKGHLNLVPWQQ